MDHIPQDRPQAGCTSRVNPHLNLVPLEVPSGTPYLFLTQYVTMYASLITVCLLPFLY